MKPRILLLKVFVLRLWFERKVSLRGFWSELVRWLARFTRSFSEKEQLRFAERASFLLRSGIPLFECLTIIALQERTHRVRMYYERLVEDVASGKPLSDALEVGRERIDPFFIACVRVGERSGNLSSNLSAIAQELKAKGVLRKKIIGALIYPSFIMFASVGIIALITAYIFPKILPIFQSLDITLPFATRLILAVSGTLSRYGLFMLGGAAAVLIVFIVLRRNNVRFRLALTRFALRAPVIGDFVRASRMSVFARMQGMLLRSGLSITDSTRVTGATFTDPFYQGECLRLYESLIEGESLSAYLGRSKLAFPSFASDMIGIGERSGSLAEMFTMLSEHFAGEVEGKIRVFTSLVEPTLMVGMGVAVGFIAISVITPLYQITEHLNG